jgi:hypothetical protein
MKTLFEDADGTHEELGGADIVEGEIDSTMEDRLKVDCPERIEVLEVAGMDCVELPAREGLLATADELRAADELCALLQMPYEG